MLIPIGLERVKLVSLLYKYVPMAIKNVLHKYIRYIYSNSIEYLAMHIWFVHATAIKMLVCLI